MKVGELWFGLGFDVDQVKLNDIVGAIGKLNLNSILAAAGVTGLVDGLKDIMDVGTELATSMNLFNKETGLSAQKMQQWSNYAARFGISGEVVSSSLDSIQKKLIGLKLGTDKSLLTPLYLLNQYGANLTGNENAFDFLSKSLEALHKMPKELRATVIGWMGLNEQLLAVDSFKGADNLPVPTEDQINKLMQYKGAWTAVGQTLRQVFTDIASDFAPSLTDFGNSINEFLLKLHDDAPHLRAVIESLVGVFLLFAGPLGQVAFILGMIATHIKEIQSAGASMGSWIGGMIGKDQSISQNRLAQEGLSSNNFLGIGKSGSGSNTQVTHNNAITIVANDIKDLEHKFIGFFEKVMTKTFYQQNFNA